jgi:hypothetical protein|tara:strand:+ start:1479 stop:2057 length:579 start_codon:yes stop_codon:yes gene_type:complete
MNKKDLMELIDSTGSIISGDYTINHDFGSDKTSDSFEKMTRQGASNFYGYRRFWGENEKDKKHSELADKLQNNPAKFFQILKKNNKESEFEDYFTKDNSEDLMKEMLEDIVTNRMDSSDLLPTNNDVEIMSLEEYSDEDPILVKWAMLIKELWMERENSERLIILNALMKDVNFTEVSPSIKEKLTMMINGE